MPENLVSRDGSSRPVPRQPAHLHTQAESGAYLRDSFRVPWRRPFMKPPYAIGSVPGLSGHVIAYRWRSLPRVRRHRASKPQGSFERVLPWQITMNQLISASLSHTHYWYEVGMLKVPANDRRTKRKIGDGVFASQPHAPPAAIVKPPPPPPGVRETEAWSPKRFGFCRRGDATLLFLRQPLFLENSVVFPHSGVYAHHAGP